MFHSGLICSKPDNPAHLFKTSGSVMTSPDLLFPMPYLLHTRFAFPLTILQTQAASCYLLEKMFKAMWTLMRGHQ